MAFLLLLLLLFLLLLSVLLVLLENLESKIQVGFGVGFPRDLGLREWCFCATGGADWRNGKSCPYKSKSSFTSPSRITSSITSSVRLSRFWK